MHIVCLVDFFFSVDIEQPINTLNYLAFIGRDRHEKTAQTQEVEFKKKRETLSTFHFVAYTKECVVYNTQESASTQLMLSYY